MGNSQKSVTTEKYTKLQKLNTIFNSQWIKEKIKKTIRKYLGINGNKNPTYQNPWDTVKMVLSKKLRAINVFIKKQDLKLTNFRT